MIRLVKIVSSSKDTLFEPVNVHCRIEHFHLDAVPTYKALSYEWGKSEGSEQLVAEKERDTPDDGPSIILVEGAILECTRNLRNFFRFARVVTGSLYANVTDCWLWIDQICINQTDLSERTHQVAQMAEIFSGASEVLVWLGDGTEEDECSQQGFVAQQAESQPSTCREPDKTDVGSWNVAQDLGDGVNAPTNPSSTRMDDALCVLTMRPYWLRLWIIQEVILARSITIIFRDKQVSWDAMMNATRRLREPSKRTQRVLDLDDLRHTIGHRGWIWKDVVPLFRSAKCADTRDRAYGMLGLVDESVQIQADYTAREAEVVKAVIHKEFAAWFGRPFSVASANLFMNDGFKEFVWTLFLAFDVWTSRRQDPSLKYIRDLL
jgi:hypothetical protein